MKPNKQLYIDFILNELEKGNVQYKDVMLVFVSKFQLTEKTFCIYWKTANTQHTERLHERNKVIEEERTTLAKERLKKAILTKFERMEIASNIAKGKAWKSGNVIIVPNASDRMKACDYLSKIDGDYAPAKIQTEIRDLRPLFPDDDELLKDTND